MKLSNWALVIALALSVIAIGMSAIKTVETPAGGFASYGTWVSTFNIRDSAVTTAKISINADLPMKGYNMTNTTNVTFGSAQSAYIYWNGTALIIRVS